MRRYAPVLARFAILFAQLNSINALLNTCFSPLGGPNFKLFACQPEAKVSSCCSPADLCYSNGLCAPGPDSPNLTYYTPFFASGCTDSTWPSPACVPNCLENR